jgi:hypothetical protein
MLDNIPAQAMTDQKNRAVRRTRPIIMTKAVYASY